MVAAMAWRVKYRKTGPDGKVRKRKLRLESLGVHPMNRGGVYPAGLRCRSLANDSCCVGFVKEELNSNVVVVEETPAEHVAGRGRDYISGSTYNRTQSKRDELLMTCFDEPYDDVRQTLLCHNHMMLVLRAFLTKAQWNLPHVEKKNLTFCDDKGCLSLTAVAESLNGKELQEALDEGRDCEVLSWQMDVEEPGAALVISIALNKGQEIALRTTELTAVAVLKLSLIHI